MKNALLFLLFAKTLTGISQHTFQLIAFEDSMYTVNPIEDSLEQIIVDQAFYEDSLMFDSLNQIIPSSPNSLTWFRDSRTRCTKEIPFIHGKYALIQRHKEDHPKLDFRHEDWSFVPVFQQFFNIENLHPNLWDNAKTNLHYYDPSQKWFHPDATYKDGFGYYGQSDCELKRYDDLDKNDRKLETEINAQNQGPYKSPYMNVYNTTFLDCSKNKRDEMVAENNYIQQHYMTKNSVVENGVLKIKTKTEPLGPRTWLNGELANFYGKDAINAENDKVELSPGGQYTRDQGVSSGYLETSKYFKEGMMLQAKIKVPNNDGLWPAFWLMGGSEFQKNNNGCGGPGNSYQEFDIFEFMGNQDDKMTTTILGPRVIGQKHNESCIKKDYFDKFHVYTIYWTECAIHVYLDEGSDRKCIYKLKKYPGINGSDCVIGQNKTYTENLRYPIYPMNIIFNVAAYNCENLRTKHDLNTSMEVEWLKVFYQKPCTEELVISDMSYFDNIDYQMFNVEVAKKIEINSQTPYTFKNKEPNNWNTVPYLKFIHENEFIIPPGSKFTIDNTAIVEDEIVSNVCQNFGRPIEMKNESKSDLIENTEPHNDKPIKTENSTTEIPKVQVRYVVFPSPTNNEVWLKIENMENADYKAELLDMKGKTLIQQTVSPTGITQLTTNHLSNGTYLVKINKNGIPCFTTFVIINHEK
jgi:beta-glucanase (GH16 family)